MLRLFLSFVLLLCFVNCIYANADTLQTMLAKMERYRKSYPQEKVHLHFDKPFYSVGDTIYFKAYVVNAEKNRPSLLGNILHVDLLNENNGVAKTLLLPLEEGVGWGDIALTDTLAEGVYTVQAYTNWMRNFDSSFFFVKKMPIGNALADDISVHTVYNAVGGTTNETQAIIQYKNLNGAPLANKRVNYVFKNGRKEIGKGNAETDANGTISVNLPAIGLKQDTAVMEILTTISTDKQRKVEKKIHYQDAVKNSSFQLFAEGGNLVAGLPCKIAFKALDGWGKSVAASGVLLDKNGKNILQFETGFAGMGSYSFTPQPGMEYEAAVKMSNGRQINVRLPEIANEGYVIAVDNVSDTNSIQLKVFASKQYIGMPFTVLLQSNNAVQYSTEGAAEADGWKLSLSKKRFPSGILQITLLNSIHEPVAERLVFTANHDQMYLDLSAIGKASRKRKKVKLPLQPKDSEGNFLTGNFSIAVTDENRVNGNENQEQTIYSNLLLTSELKGHIEQPGYYFEGDIHKRAAELDNLMLTQGWRRFVWTDVLAGKYPPIVYNPEKDLQISGFVQTPKGVPVPNASVKLISKGGAGFIIDTLADANGDFLFNNLYYTDDMPYMVQAKTPGGNDDVVVHLNGNATPMLAESNDFALYNTGDTALQTYLLSSNQRFGDLKKRGLINTNARVLENVTVNAKKISKIQEAVRPSYNLNGPGNADQILTYLDLRNCHDLAYCIQGKLIGVYFKADGTGKVFPYSTQTMVKGIDLDANGRTIGNTNKERPPMALVVDGIMMGTETGINNIDAADVQSIEVLRSGAKLNVYGLRGVNGIIVITRKSGSINYNQNIAEIYGQPDTTPLNGVVYGTAKGFYTAKQFYTPSEKEMSNEELADFRSTIYWKPNVYTNEDGEASVEFYNGGTTSRYKVVIEGISPMGKIAREVFYYDVK